KRIGSAKAAAAQDRRLIALVERGIAAVVVDALTGIGRAPASAGPRRLAPLRARPALGVSVGEQQSHHCDTEQHKTDRAHGSSPSPSCRPANVTRRPAHLRQPERTPPPPGLRPQLTADAAGVPKPPPAPKMPKMLGESPPGISAGAIFHPSPLPKGRPQILAAGTTVCGWLKPAKCEVAHTSPPLSPWY